MATWLDLFETSDEVNWGNAMEKKLFATDDLFTTVTCLKSFLELVNLL